MRNKNSDNAVNILKEAFKKNEEPIEIYSDEEVPSMCAGSLCLGF